MLPHEHLLIDLRGVAFQEPEDDRGRALARAPLAMENLGWVRRHWTSSMDNLVQLDEALATAELQAFAATGGRTLVDATVPGIGRDPAALVRMSVATGVHIVMGAGTYVEPSHPPDVLSRAAGPTTAVHRPATARMVGGRLGRRRRALRRSRAGAH